MVNMTYTLKQLREELKMTQLAVAAKAGTSLNSVVNSERPDKKLHYSTLLSILKVINEERVNRNLSEIHPNEMEWNIR